MRERIEPTTMASWVLSSWREAPIFSGWHRQGRRPGRRSSALPSRHRHPSASSGGCAALDGRGAASGPRRGSALILAVVLTSLLAIVGVLFVLGARIDKMASSATADNRELSLAVDTVLAQINEALVLDVPGVGSNQEYYDYPDANNVWLANAEPYAKAGASGSRDGLLLATDQQSGGAAHSRHERRSHPRRRRARAPQIDDPNMDTNADADGDGVGDARWFQVPGMMSGKGRPIYAAVRILDNGGMLNVNTGYKFDPAATDPNLVNGAAKVRSMSWRWAKAVLWPPSIRACVRPAASTRCPPGTGPTTSGKCSGSIPATRTRTIPVLSRLSICPTSWSCGTAIS